MALVVQVAAVVNELPHDDDACNTCDAGYGESEVAPTAVGAVVVGVIATQLPMKLA